MAQTKRLGEGEYEVRVMQRGGRTQIASLDNITQLTYQRRLDSISQAQVVIGKPDASCCENLSKIEPIGHELLILRNGERVWEGPITNIVETRSTFTVTAADVLLYFDLVEMDSDVIIEDSASLTEALQTLIDQYLFYRPNDNIEPFLQIFASSSLGRREYGNEVPSRTVWNLMQELLRTTFDVVVVGRRIVFYDQEAITPILGVLRDDDFLGDLEFEKDGSIMANRTTVVGEEGASGEAQNNRYELFYGAVHRSWREEEILDDGSALTAAQTRLDLLERPPRILRVPQGSRLSPDTGIEINELFPGAKIRVDLVSFCNEVSQDFRVSAVDVTVSRIEEFAGQTGSASLDTTGFSPSSFGGESVGITLTPEGTLLGAAGGT